MRALMLSYANGEGTSREVAITPKGVTVSCSVRRMWLRVQPSRPKQLVCRNCQLKCPIGVIAEHGLNALRDPIIRVAVRWNEAVAAQILFDMFINELNGSIYTEAADMLLEWFYSLGTSFSPPIQS